MGKPRLIFVNRVYWPNEAATAQLLTDLAEGLAARDWEVHVIAAGIGDEVRRGVRIHRAGSFEQHAGALSQLGNYGRFTRAAGRLLDAFLAPGDIVVLKTDPPQLAPALTQRSIARGAWVVQWIQDIYPEILGGHLGRWVNGILLPLRVSRDRAWRQAARCVIVGGDMRAVLLRHGVSEARITLLPNWAPRELDTPAGAAEVATARKEMGRADDFLVAYSGNLGRVHEFQTVLQAAALLRSDQGICFLFIGRGPRLAEAQARTRSLGLSNVRFLPPLPRNRLAAGLAAPDAHLVSLRPEFTGLVNPSKLAGAAAAGRPILYIGDTTGANPRLLAGEEFGYTVATNDAAGLAAHIRSLRADPALAARMGRNARASYARHFTADSALAGWDDLLRGLDPRQADS
jgi:glycosyltransferase involved in cell wall biosynthesis